MYMAEVESRVNHHLEGNVGERPVREGEIRIGGIQIAAEQEGEIHLSPFGSFHTLQGVHATGGGQVDAELGADAVEYLLLQRWRHTHGADALHIAVTAQGQQTATWRPDHAAKQCQIADSLDILHAPQMVRDAHAPTEDGVFGRTITVGELTDLLLADTGPADQIR